MTSHKVHIRIAAPEDTQAYDKYMKGVFEEHLPTLIPSRHPTPPSLSAVCEFISKHDGNLKSVLFLALNESEVVGTAHLTNMERKELDHTVALGLNIKKSFRGRGIGTALLKHLMDWAKEKPDIERIELEVLANNHQAIHMYEKAGFIREGIKKYAVKKDSGYIDIVIMGILLQR